MPQLIGNIQPGQRTFNGIKPPQATVQPRTGALDVSNFFRAGALQVQERQLDLREQQLKFNEEGRILGITKEIFDQSFNEFRQNKTSGANSSGLNPMYAKHAEHLNKINGAMSNAQKKAYEYALSSTGVNPGERVRTISNIVNAERGSLLNDPESRDLRLKEKLYNQMLTGISQGQTNGKVVSPKFAEFRQNYTNWANDANGASAMGIEEFDPSRYLIDEKGSKTKINNWIGQAIGETEYAKVISAADLGTGLPGDVELNVTENVQRSHDEILKLTKQQMGQDPEVLKYLDGMGVQDIDGYLNSQIKLQAREAHLQTINTKIGDINSAQRQAAADREVKTEAIDDSFKSLYFKPTTTNEVPIAVEQSILDSGYDAKVDNGKLILQEVSRVIKNRGGISALRYCPPDCGVDEKGNPLESSGDLKIYERSGFDKDGNEVEERIIGTFPRTSLPKKGFSDKTNLRTDRHNNPAAITTDVARQAGLVEGVDFEQGDAFPENEGGNRFHTATLLGDPVDITEKVIDNIGFFTQDGTPRWAHEDINFRALEGEWPTATKERRREIIETMYKHEGGNGNLIKPLPEGEAVDNINEPVQAEQIERFHPIEKAVLSGQGVDNASLFDYLRQNPDIVKDEELKHTITNISGVVGKFETLSKVFDKLELDRELGENPKTVKVPRGKRSITMGVKEFEKELEKITTQLQETSFENLNLNESIANEIAKSLPISEEERTESYESLAETIISDIEVNGDVELHNGEVIESSRKDGSYIIEKDGEKTRVSFNELVEYIGKNYPAMAIQQFPPDTTESKQAKKEVVEKVVNPFSAKFK